MRPAAITAAIVSLIWLIWRLATADCCPHPDLGDDDELSYIPAKPWDDSKLDALLGGDE